MKYVLVHVELANIMTEVSWVLGHSRNANLLAVGFQLFSVTPTHTQPCLAPNIPGTCTLSYLHSHCAHHLGCLSHPPFNWQGPGEMRSSLEPPRGQMEASSSRPPQALVHPLPLPALCEGYHRWDYRSLCGDGESKVWVCLFSYLLCPAQCLALSTGPGSKHPVTF